MTTLPAFDPASGFHVDPDVGTPARPPARAGRDRRSIQLILRSTPSGALAMVDGVNLGPTPTLWEGPADGAPHDFTFRLAGYGLARYRFIPVTAGVVHGTLARLPDDKVDLGAPVVEGANARPTTPDTMHPPAPTPPIDAADTEPAAITDAAPANPAPGAPDLDAR